MHECESPARPEAWRAAVVAATAATTMGVGLGSGRRLSYHEAIVAQSAREMMESGFWLVPTIGGVPWLEKPPLPQWLVMLVSSLGPGVTELTARLPSALAGTGLCVIVLVMTARRLGWRLGMMAALIQATTVWTVTRGRLADADMLLAFLVAAAMACFDRIRMRTRRGRTPGFERLGLFVAVGLMSMVKGIGFGVAIAGAAGLATLVWDRDWATLRRLIWLPGLAVAVVLGLVWPMAVLGSYPEAGSIWLGHVVDRLGEQARFAGDSTAEFLLAPLVQCLPWTPLAVLAMGRSGRRAGSGRGRLGFDRLLWAWAVVPVLMLAMATTKNDHYLIHALPPWSIWAARGLAGLGTRLRDRRGWRPETLRRAALGMFGVLGVGYAVGLGVLGARFDDRGREWAWYRQAGPETDVGLPLVLLYDWDGPDPWDRLPYPTPYGAVPHDLAVRLFYLGRPASRRPVWVSGRGDPAAQVGAVVDSGAAFQVIARPRDLEALAGLGWVEVLAEGPDHRWDRCYQLATVRPRRVRDRALRDEAVQAAGGETTLK